MSLGGFTPNRQRLSLREAEPNGEGCEFKAAFSTFDHTMSRQIQTDLQTIRMKTPRPFEAFLELKIVRSDAGAQFIKIAVQLFTHVGDGLPIRSLQRANPALPNRLGLSGRAGRIGL